MFILQMAFKLSRKDVEDMYKNEWAQPSGNWRKKFLVWVEKGNSSMPWLINFRTIMALLFVLMLAAWVEWKRQYMKVFSTALQVKGVIFTPTARLDPRAGVVISETETVSNMVLACLMLLLQKWNLCIKDWVKILCWKKCLHGKTQNQNETTNGMVWERIPEEVFVGADLLEFGSFDAVSHFNIGARTVLLLLKALKIFPRKLHRRGVQAPRPGSYSWCWVQREQRKLRRGERS